MTYVTRTLSLLVFFLWSIVAMAAPLDEFLMALPGHAPGHGELEVGYDVMNSAVDLLNMREGYQDSRGDSIGNYSGAHVRGTLALTRRLSADVALWKRGMETPFDEGESVAWQGAVQYQATVNLGWLPAVALRVSGWGDSADEVLKGSMTNLFNQGNALLAARTTRVEDPRDMQFQGDMIGSWSIGRDTVFSLFGSMGTSRVRSGGVFAELDASPGCEHEIVATSTGRIDLRLSEGDPGSCFSLTDINLSFPVPTGLFIRYDATYMQVGGSLQWFNDTWRSRFGYRFQAWDRGDLDDAVLLYQHAERISYETNHHITAEVGYKLREQTGIFVRGQAMQYQFVGDVPFSYNLFSAHKFKSRYGFLTFGIVQGF